jgi:hypothetical protein
MGGMPPAEYWLGGIPIPLNASPCLAGPGMGSSSTSRHAAFLLHLNENPAKENDRTCDCESEKIQRQMIGRHTSLPHFSRRIRAKELRKGFLKES